MLCFMQEPWIVGGEARALKFRHTDLFYTVEVIDPVPALWFQKTKLTTYVIATLQLPN